MAMTSRDKLELTLKVAGIAFVVEVLALLPWVVRGVRLLVDAPSKGTTWSSAGRAAVGMLAFPTVSALLALALIACARPIARRLTGRDGGGWAPGAPEVLHVGFRLLGLLWLIGLVALLAVNVGQVEFSFWPPAGVAAGMVVLFLVCPSVPVSVGLRCVGRSAAAAGEGAGRLAAGIVLVCTYRMLAQLEAIVSRTISLLTPGMIPLSEPDLRAQFLQGLGADIVGLALAVGLASQAGRLAALVAARRTGGDEQDAPALRLQPSTWLSLSVFAGAAYLFVTYLQHMTESRLFAWKGLAAVGALAHLLIVPAAVAVVWFWIIRRIGWRLGARLWGRPLEPGETESAGAALAAAEVCVAVVALLTLTGCVGWGLKAALERLAGLREVEWFGWRLPRVLAALPAAGLLLLFHGDAAWLFCGRRGGAEADAAPWRARMLRPWIALLGVWLVTGNGAAPIWWVVSRVALRSELYVPPLAAFFGVGYVLGAWWLARKLSYGRLTPAIRREFGSATP